MQQLNPFARHHFDLERLRQTARVSTAYVEILPMSSLTNAASARAC
jgi:hypothetical protein